MTPSDTRRLAPAPGAARISGLYAITPSGPLNKVLLDCMELALSGGARMVQLRAKDAPLHDVERAARALRSLTRRHCALFIVNDHVELARQVEADGVHLGRDDASWDRISCLANEGLLVGVSCYNDMERARAAATAGAGYVAFGSVFPSRTKPKAVRVTLDQIRSARAELRIPIVAIGGIESGNASSVVEAGADAIAVISGLFNAPDVKMAATAYASAFPSPSAPPMSRSLA